MSKVTMASLRIWQPLCLRSGTCPRQPAVLMCWGPLNRSLTSLTLGKKPLRGKNSKEQQIPDKSTQRMASHNYQQPLCLRLKPAVSRHWMAPLQPSSATYSKDTNRRTSAGSATSSCCYIGVLSAPAR